MLVMHVGPHKTATTYIQNNLAENRGFLERAGWIYPLTAQDGAQAHHNLAHHADLYLGPDASLKDDLTETAELAASAGKSVVFSAEGFCRWKMANFTALAEMMGVDVIDVVYTIREPYSLLHSFWSEEVKQGHTRSLADRYINALTSPLDNRLLNPLLDLIPLIQNKKIRLHIMPYEYLMRLKVDIFQHMCSTVLGLDEVPIKQRTRKNTSYSIEMTEFLRLLTLIHGNDAPFIGSAFRLHFTDKTTVEARADMAALLKQHAQPARHVLKVPGSMVTMNRLEALLRKRLDGLWTVDPGEEPLFAEQERRLVYYNEYHLWKTDAVREAAIAIERDVAAKMPS